LLALSLVACSVNTEEVEAAGVWCYLPVFDRLKPITFDPYEGDPNKQFLQAPYISKWSGTFNGESTDYGLIIAHVLDPNAPGAPMVFVDAASFRDVEVDGKVGHLEMDVLGDRPDPTAEWRGTWVLTSGTGELEGIHGNGTFWGPGWYPETSTEECGDWGLIYYAVDSLGFNEDG
jgi:hypothetical protein